MRYPIARFNGRLTQIRNPYTPSEKQTAQAPQQSTITNFDGVIEVDNAGSAAAAQPHGECVDRRVEDGERVAHSERGAAGADPAGPELAASAATGWCRPIQWIRRWCIGCAGGNRNAIPEPVLVKLGITDNISTQVLDGLKEGDTVITGIPSRIEIPQRRGLF